MHEAAASCSGVGLVSSVACCVRGVAAHRALREQIHSPDRMFGFDCHVYFKYLSKNKTRVRLIGAEEDPRGVKRVTGA
eukprot:5210489-Prymnesium_polylepis.2